MKFHRLSLYKYYRPKIDALKLTSQWIKMVRIVIDRLIQNVNPRYTRQNYKMLKSPTQADSSWSIRNSHGNYRNFYYAQIVLSCPGINMLKYFNI